MKSDQSISDLPKTSMTHKNRKQKFSIKETLEASLKGQERLLDEENKDPGMISTVRRDV